jgi:hypothetical protein
MRRRRTSRADWKLKSADCVQNLALGASDQLCSVDFVISTYHVEVMVLSDNKNKELKRSICMHVRGDLVDTHYCSSQRGSEAPVPPLVLRNNL